MEIVLKDTEIIKNGQMYTIKHWKIVVSTARRRFLTPSDIVIVFCFKFIWTMLVKTRSCLWTKQENSIWHFQGTI